MPRNSNIKEVAKKVIKQIQQGERPNVTRAMLAVGYSRQTAKSKQHRIKAHKDYINTMETFEKQLDRLINDAVEIATTKKAKASYRDGIEGIDKLRKLKALINGNPTENTKMTVGWE